mgnify:FL=1
MLFRSAITDRVVAGRVLVDGLGVGDVGNIVLRDRKQLSQDGIMIIVVALSKANSAVIAGPDVVTRGFVYVRESEELMESARKKTQEALENCAQRNVKEWSLIKAEVRERLGKHLYEKTGRRPMILPIIMEA